LTFPLEQNNALGIDTASANYVHKDIYLNKRTNFPYTSVV